MWTGTIVLYEIPRVVMAENENFKGAENWLASKGIELVNLNMPEAIEMMGDYIKKNPKIWYEDIGEDDTKVAR